MGRRRVAARSWTADEEERRCFKFFRLNDDGLRETAERKLWQVIRGKSLQLRYTAHTVSKNNKNGTNKSCSETTRGCNKPQQKIVFGWVPALTQRAEPVKTILETNCHKFCSCLSQCRQQDKLNFRSISVFITTFGVHRPLHSDWRTESQKNEHRYSVFCRIKTSFHVCLPCLLLFYTDRYFQCWLTLQFALIDIRIVSMFLVLFFPDLTFAIPQPDLQTHWPLQALTEVSTRKQITQNTAVVHMFVLQPQRENWENKRETAALTKGSDT